MGQVVVRLIHGTPGVKLAGAVDHPKSPGTGKDAGELAGVGKLGIRVGDRLEPLLGKNTAIIDFTSPDASLGFLRSAVKRQAPMVICTTGFNAKQIAEIRKLGRRTRALLSPNMSVGVNLLISLLGKAAKSLGDDYDVEIVEAHHHLKRDAPSGTAFAMAREIAQALKRDLDKVGVYGRKGIVGERKKKEIGVVAVRAGDIVGEHTVIFGGIGERIEFIHRAHSRENFARGAVRAVQWLVKQKKGFYSMKDVLGLG
jgi:4-hydroxy-tetrahydrodipicolinate reductase